MPKWAKGTARAALLTASFVALGASGTALADTTGGAGSLIGGNQASTPSSVPVDVSGNAVAGAGKAEGASRGGASAPASDSGQRTTGNGSVLGGNQVNAPVQAPVNVCGNAVAVFGTAKADCKGGATVADGNDGVGGNQTSGAGSVGGGNQLRAPIGAPVNICGNAVAIAGHSAATCQGGAVVNNDTVPTAGPAGSAVPGLSKAPVAFGLPGQDQVTRLLMSAKQRQAGPGELPAPAGVPVTPPLTDGDAAAQPVAPVVPVAPANPDAPRTLPAETGGLAERPAGVPDLGVPGVPVRQSAPVPSVPGVPGGGAAEQVLTGKLPADPQSALSGDLPVKPRTTLNGRSLADPKGAVPGKLPLPAKPGDALPGKLPAKPADAAPGKLPAGTGALDGKAPMAADTTLPMKPGGNVPGKLPADPGAVSGKMPAGPGGTLPGDLPAKPGGTLPGKPADTVPGKLPTGTGALDGKAPMAATLPTNLGGGLPVKLPAAPAKGLSAPSPTGQGGILSGALPADPTGALGGKLPGDAGAMLRRVPIVTPDAPGPDGGAVPGVPGVGKGGVPGKLPTGELPEAKLPKAGLPKTGLPAPGGVSDAGRLTGALTPRQAASATAGPVVPGQSELGKAKDELPADAKINKPGVGPVIAGKHIDPTRVVPTVPTAAAGSMTTMGPGWLFGLAVSSLLAGGAVLMAVTRRVRLQRR